MKHTANVNLKFGVNVKPMILKDGKIVREYPMIHNLILNSGLEALATNYVVNCFSWAAIGDGTTATMKDSSDVGAVVSVTGTTASVDGGAISFFTSADASNKRVIYFADGQSATINTFTSVYEVELVESLTVTSQVAIVYNVEQTQLANRIKSSNTYYDTSNGENGTKFAYNLAVEKAPSNVTRSGNTVTWSGGNFEASDVGKNIRIGIGNMSTIKQYNSATEVLIEDTTSILTSGAAIIGQYQVIQRWRTFEFTEEVSPVTYKEAGWSWGDPASTNLFGRVLFTEQGTNVTVETGEKLLLYVELNTYLDRMPYAIDPLPITNLAVAAKYRNMFVTGGAYSSVNPDGSGSIGSVTNSGDGTVYEPYAGQEKLEVVIGENTWNIYSDAGAASPYGTGPVHAVVSVPLAAAYVPNSYEKYFKAFFTGASVDLTTNWGDIIATNGATYRTDGLRIAFDSVQSKTLSNTVQLIFKKSWGRYFA